MKIKKGIWGETQNNSLLGLNLEPISEKKNKVRTPWANWSYGTLLLPLICEPRLSKCLKARLVRVTAMVIQAKAVPRCKKRVGIKD